MPKIKNIHAFAVIDNNGKKVIGFKYKALAVAKAKQLKGITGHYHEVSEITFSVEMNQYDCPIMPDWYDGIPNEDTSPVEDHVQWS